jgi:hypothetical protein
MKHTSVFENLVDITEKYLGPAARRFVIRQVAFHLDKPPEELEARDIPELIEWTRATLALLTEDKTVLSDYAREASQLAVVQ